MRMEHLRSLMKVASTYSRCRSFKLLQKRNVTTSSALQYKWEPDLNLEPDIPEYESLLVKLQGYEYRALESFQNFVHSKAVGLGIECRGFPVPAKKTDIRTMQFNTSTEKDQLSLSYCERAIQLYDVPTLKVPILLDLITPHTPEGVKITIKETTPEDEEFIYIPNQDRKKILEMLDTIEKQRQ